MTPLRPLSALEATALMQIRISAKLDPKHRLAINRLVHFGLVNETPAGWHVTREGEQYCRREAGRLGLLQPATA